MAVRAIDHEYKNKIGKRLANRLGVAIARGKISANDVSSVCQQILPAIDAISTYEGLVQFFEKLSLAWPFFREILQEEERVTFVGKGSAFYGH